MKGILYKIGYFIYRFLIKSKKEINHKTAKKKYDIHNSVNLWHNTFITGKGKIKIGKGTYIGQHTYISANPKEAKLTIGENCAISHNVQIRTGTYNPVEFVNNRRITSFNDIEIGNNNWIGANVFISGGVKLGNNVIVGANSFVNKSFGNNVIIGGIPAKVLKSL